MRILFSTFGSFGDVFPYLAIGGELRRRGHKVTIATCPVYRGRVESAGLSFHPVRPDAFLDDQKRVAYLMDAKHGAERLIRLLAGSVRETYADILPAANASDVVVTHPLAFGAMLALQKLRIPWVSTVTAPISLSSVHDPPVLPHALWIHQLRFLGPRFTRFCFGFVNRRFNDWIAEVLAFRAELGINDADLGDAGRPALVLAMFTASIAGPQPDWPKPIVVTGFPFLDDDELGGEVQRFLDAGTPPIVFTLGTSAVATAGDFYADSLRAIEKLGARAVFLTGSHPQGLPSRLPDTVLAIPYAPHAPLFARSAALVHHAGAGTMGQAMRAGRPMLVVPFGHDQFDNAERLRRLGAAVVLHPARYSARTAAKALAGLMQNASYSATAEKLAQEVRSENGAVTGADAIDQLLDDAKAVNLQQGRTRR